jgi:nucleotide-binding universal stress UspA family protein
MTVLLGDERMQELKSRMEERARETLIGKKRDALMIQEAFQKMAEDIRAKSGSPAVSDEIIITEGDISGEIVDRAEKSRCDLIVMGSRKHGLLTKSYVGATVKSVLQRSKIPVLVVPPADKG